jgi:D-alanyl-D-alanine carboxypeptidase/D-alanyl-D-alanine-endopeptidase (penicillin-binding protein 4)
MRFPPSTRSIPEQLPYVGYNPSISALNLNFNRVFFEWERAGEEYTVRMDARSDNHSPMVTVSRMTIEPRDYPVYTFDGPRHGTNGPSRKAHWATGAGAGCRFAARPPTSRRCSRCWPAPGASRWHAPVSESAPPGANVLVEYESAPLEEILRGMMRWSTNLTAEVVGLSATQAGGVRPTTLAESGPKWRHWMRDRLGARQARFVDHSGLGVESRFRPNDMTRALVAAGPDGILRGLMRDIPSSTIRKTFGRRPLRVVAKTGTLNFVSTLAGYVQASSGRTLAFSVFCADLDRGIA